MLIWVHQLADYCYSVLPKLCFLSCSWTWIRVTKFMGRSSQRFSGTLLQSGTHANFLCRSRGNLPFIQKRICFLQISCKIVYLGRSWNVAFTKMFFLSSIRVTRCEPVTQYVGTTSTPPAMCMTWRAAARPTVTDARESKLLAICHLAWVRWMTHSWTRPAMPGNLQAVWKVTIATFRDLWINICGSL